MTPEAEACRAQLRTDLRNAVYRMADAQEWRPVRLSTGEWLTDLESWAEATAHRDIVLLQEMADALLTPTS